MKMLDYKKSHIVRVFKNAVSLLGNKILTGLINLVFISYLARHLSQNDFGMYTTTVTFLAFSSIFADFGISTVLIREIAKNKMAARAIFSNSIFLAVKFSILAWLGIIAVGMFFNYPTQIILLISLSGGTIIFNSLIGRLTAVMSAFERMEIFSSIGVILSFVFTLVGILLLRLNFGLKGVVVLMVIWSAISFFIFFHIVQKWFIRFEFKFNFKIAYMLLKESFTIFILISFSILLGKMDILMLSKIRTMQEVGIYGVAVQLNEALGAITGCFLGAIFPFLSSQWEASLQASYNIYKKSLKVFIISASFLTMILFLLSHQIIPFIFGKQFEPSFYAFRILILVFWINHIGGPIGLFLIVQKKKLKIVMVYSAIVICINFILNFILIPKYSYIGASIVAVFCSFLLLIAKFHLVSTMFENYSHPIALVLKSSFAALLTGIIIFFMRNVFFPIAFSIGLPIYIVLLIILGELKTKSLTNIYESIRSKF